MNEITFCLIFTALFAFCFATQFSDCGSATGEVSSVEVSNCPDGQDVCILKKGTQSEIKINFKAKADSKSLTTIVQGIVSHVPIPFPLPQSDACKTGVTCPVKNGEDYTYDNNLDIKNAYPEVSVTVRFKLKDESDSDMVCVEIPCKIQK